MGPEEETAVKHILCGHGAQKWQSYQVVVVAVAAAARAFNPSIQRQRQKDL